MDAKKLIDSAKILVADGKGLLAMDESTPTCNKRFAKLGIPQTVEARRAYRELIITTPGLGESISGVILYDATIRQQMKEGTPFAQVITDAGILPGIKVDTGAKEMAGHPGSTCPKQETVDAVADATVWCLLRAVPAAVPGIAFLSGGQPAELASARLNAMNVRFDSRLPWELAFSFARAIQQPALDIWQGAEANARSKPFRRRTLCYRKGQVSYLWEPVSAIFLCAGRSRSRSHRCCSTHFSELKRGYVDSTGWVYIEGRTPDVCRQWAIVNVPSEMDLWDVFESVIEQQNPTFPYKIGPREEARARLAALLPTTDFSDERFAWWESERFSVEFDFSFRPVITSISLAVRGDTEAALPHIRSWCKTQNWRAFDVGGDWIA